MFNSGMWHHGRGGYGVDLFAEGGAVGFGWLVKVCVWEGVEVPLAI